MTIAAYTAVCQEDACWIGQYLTEVERLGIPFAIHLDRCMPMTKAYLISHKQCIGYTETYTKAGEFNETHKQKVFDLVVRRGYDWALGWDIDETWEKDAPTKLQEIGSRTDCEYIDYRWANLWGDSRHARVDGVFGGGHRCNLYRLTNVHYSWKFSHPITNGPAPCSNKHRCKMTSSDLVCLHWGMMTKQYRQIHKARWDRIYTRAVGKNPYGFWNYALDESIVPTIIEHNYF